MILFGADDRHALWLGGLPQARELSSCLGDRKALRGRLAQIPAAGDVSMVLPGALFVEGKCSAEQLCEAAQAFAAWAELRSMKARVILTSSALVYGSPTPGILVREEDAKPADEAGRALLSLEGELFARARRRGFSVVAARLFEVLEPRGLAGGPHVEIARQVKSGQLGEVRGLGLTRDWLDARDLAQAFSLLAQIQDEREPSVEAINVCSGRAITGHELLREIVKVLRPKDETALMASAHGTDEQGAVPWLVGNASLFAQRTGYPVARIALKQTIEDACLA